MCPHVEMRMHIASALGFFLFCFVGGYQQINKERTHIKEGEGAVVLCKTPRVSVFGPHSGESLAEAKWTKVNKSGHYVWAPVNSCSLVSLCFKKRGGRCDHEESPCLFFSSHYRGGSGSPPLPPPSSSSLPFSAFSFCFLFLSPVHFCHPSPLRPSPLAVSLCPPSVPQTCRKGEINGVLGEGITQLNFDENRRKEEEGRTSRGGEGM